MLIAKITYLKIKSLEGSELVNTGKCDSSNLQKKNTSLKKAESES